MKRHRSPNSAEEGSARAKLPMTSSRSTTAEPQAEPRIRISVTLRSATKAARNDPLPPKEYSSKMLERVTANDSNESTSTNSVRTTEGPHDLAGPQASSAAGPPEYVKGEHPAGITGADDEKVGNGDNNDDHVDEDHDDDDGDHIDDDDDDDWGGYSDGDDDDAQSYDDGVPWLEEIDGFVTLNPMENQPATSRRAENSIAECNAKLIRRNQMRESFWLEMEGPLQETHDLAFDLFDRYGRLDPEFYEHDLRKGTGVWGNELDHGDILLFETLKVSAGYRQRRIGTKIVNAIMETTRKKVSNSVGFFALVRPGFLISELPSGALDPDGVRQAEKEMCRASLRFWQSLGFRRVGISSWLARTDCHDHPSRHLKIDQDWQQPEEVGGFSLSDKLKQIFERLADPAVDENDCMEAVKTAFPEDSEEQQWLSFDRDGNTLLHIAAMTSRLELVKFVFSKASHLAAVRNKEGYTALEALRNRLEHQRTRRSNGHRTQPTSDSFKGFSAESIACISVLENIATFDLATLTQQDIEAAASATDEQIRMLHQRDIITGIRNALRYKYGCTCGECIGGFLSPRMKFALLCVAEIQHDMMHEFMDQPGPNWVDDHCDLLTHLPDYVRENLKTNKSMRQGFANMCDHFAECLRRGIMPTEQGVLGVFNNYQSEWPPVTKSFLQRGGTVAAVADMIFENAMEWDEWAGNGHVREVFGEKVDKLVACRNDHEFGFVAGICGYKRVRPVSSRFVDMFGQAVDLD